MVASEQEEFVLQLWDSFWFEYEILKSHPTKTAQKTSQCVPQQNEKFKISRPPTLIVRSFSEEHLSSNDEFINSDRTEPSPKSVLVVPKLQSILSGKEVEEFGDNAGPKRESFPCNKTEENEGRETRIVRRRRGQKGNSKSLSELEFAELKGFMDLGFIFDKNEVKNSSLFSILPGLQRLGTDNEGSMVIVDNEDTVSRPYLSEAWEVLEEKQKRKDVYKKKDPLKNWRIPNYGNEMELKDHLKVWAHNVASAVR